MASDDAAVLVHENGVRPAELRDARRDLLYLLSAVGAGVLGVWHQLVDLPVGDG